MAGVSRSGYYAWLKAAPIKEAREQKAHQGIRYYGEMVYFKDETVEDYLERNDILDNRKYPVYVHDIVDTDNWLSRDDFERINDSAVPVDWPERIDGYIDGLEDEDVLVGVDYHI